MSPTGERLVQRANDEQALRDAGDPEARLNGAMKLGQFYLDQDRLDDAQTFFASLETDKAPVVSALGSLGRGVVKALQDDKDESNTLFLKACQKPDDLKQVLAVPQWRVWIGRARWCNKQNGLAERDVPAPLRANFPVTTEKLPKKPTQPKEK